MKKLITTFGFAFLLVAPAFAADDSLLARITVYWPGEGQVRACSNGARLRAGHCAVDPKRVPFGSRVLFPDAACVAVDSGPDVVSRKAARVTGRTVSQRNAIVIDRFFESKEAALAWADAHPQFMTVRVMRPGSAPEPEAGMLVSAEESTRDALPMKKPSVPSVNANGMQLADNTADSATSPVKRRSL